MKKSIIKEKFPDSSTKCFNAHLREISKSVWTITSWLFQKELPLESIFKNTKVLNITERKFAAGREGTRTISSTDDFSTLK